MSGLLGADVSSVRIHAGPGAQSTTLATGAPAYAVGEHVAFRPGPSLREPQKGVGFSPTN